MESVYGAVVLSKGGTWNPNPASERPYLMPITNGLRVWPDQSTATAVFSDASGAPLVSVDGDVQPDGIYFSADASIMDAVPAGANFEIILETLDGTYPIRYGQVIRKEPFYAGAVSTVANPLMFTDNFQRTALGSNWINLLGSAQMIDNSAHSYPTGVAAKSSPWAGRFWKEFTTDTMQLGVTVLNLNPSNASSTGIVIGGDVNFQSGVCLQLNAGTGATNTHLGTLTSPTTLVDEVAPVADTVANLDYYLIQYVNSTAMLSVYKNQNLETPLISWKDSAGVVPHGPGYRSFGLVLTAPGPGNGIQVVSIAAQDTV